MKLISWIYAHIVITKSKERRRDEHRGWRSMLIADCLGGDIISKYQVQTHKTNVVFTG